MLYFTDSQDINGVTVYRDSDPGNDHIFYLIPPYPRCRRDAAGNPVFQLIKYVGGATSGLPRVPATSAEKGQPDEVRTESIPTVEGEIAGGLLSFDTEFVVDPQTQETIRATLDQQVRSRYLSDGRVVPEGFKIILRQPLWTDGAVKLLLEDTSQGLFTCVSKSSHPSLLNNNAASFAAVLAPWQASLMQGALREGNFAPIQVGYELKFLAKLPPVRIHIHASASDFYRLYKEYGTRINAGCTDPTTTVRKITEQVISNDAVTITIDSGGLTLDDKNYQALQEMALGMVQEWIKKEFYKAPPERASKEQIQDIQLQELVEGDFRNLDIHIEQSATVEHSIYPTGTMGALLSGETGLERLVHEVNLDADEFFQKRRLGIKVYADFPEAGATPQPTDVRFVEVTAFYGDRAGETRTWDATGGGASTANGDRWLVEWHKIPGEKEVRWEAKIHFRDDSKSQTLTGTSDKTELNIAVVTPGRARLRIGQVSMPWEAIQHVKATVTFRQDNADPREIERDFFLNPGSAEQWFDEPIWTKRTQPFYATLEYHLKNGNVIQQAEHRNIPVKGDRFDVQSPFEDYLTVNVQAAFTSPDWVSDIVDLVYHDEANGYRLAGQVVLSEKGGWRQTWAVPLLEPTRTQFKYYWSRKYQEGEFSSKDLEGASADGVLTGDGNSLVMTGDPNGQEDMLRVVVDPLVLFVGLPDPSKDVLRAIVHLRYTQSGSSFADTDDHVFNKGDAAWMWKQHIRNKHHKRFDWWAEYYTKPYSRVTMGTESQPFTSTGETVVLVPPGNG